MTSYHPKDIEYGYCGNCHRFTRGEQESNMAERTIPIDELVPRGIYRLYSRNLLVGVWNGKTDKWCGFVGIREKFGDRFLFSEYHWDTGAPYGTARPLELIGIVPEGIDLQEGYHPEQYKEKYPEKYQGEFFYENKELFDVLAPYDKAEEDKEGEGKKEGWR